MPVAPRHSTRSWRGPCRSASEPLPRKSGTGRSRGRRHRSPSRWRVRAGLRRRRGTLPHSSHTRGCNHRESGDRQRRAGLGASPRPRGGEALPRHPGVPGGRGRPQPASLSGAEPVDALRSVIPEIGAKRAVRPGRRVAADRPPPGGAAWRRRPGGDEQPDRFPRRARTGRARSPAGPAGSPGPGSESARCRRNPPRAGREGRRIPPPPPIGRRRRCAAGGSRSMKSSGQAASPTRKASAFTKPVPPMRASLARREAHAEVVGRLPPVPGACPAGGGASPRRSRRGNRRPPELERAADAADARVLPLRGPVVDGRLRGAEGITGREGQVVALPQRQEEGLGEQPAGARADVHHREQEAGLATEQRDLRPGERQIGTGSSMKRNRGVTYTTGQVRVAVRPGSISAFSARISQEGAPPQQSHQVDQYLGGEQHHGLAARDG